MLGARLRAYASWRRPDVIMMRDVGWMRPWCPGQARVARRCLCHSGLVYGVTESRGVVRARAAAERKP